MHTLIRQLLSPRAVLIWALRAAIAAVVALPLVVMAVQVQERLAGAPPPQLIELFVGMMCAKGALLVLLGRTFGRVAGISELAPVPSDATGRDRARLTSPSMSTQLAISHW